MVGKDLLMATLFGGGSGGSSSGGGGGSAGVTPKEVNFYDYDGTCVHAYTVAEAQALSELPAGPEHPGLVFQGWNWSLEGVKGLTRAMNIGAMYTTDDGTTRLYITLQEGRTSPMLGIGVNGTVTVDWGDGTEPDVLTGTYLGTTKWTPNHTYPEPGDYVIRLTVEGEAVFIGDSGTNQGACVLRNTNSNDVRNGVYKSSLQRVEIGNGVVGIREYAFYECANLSTITVPDNVISIEGTTFGYCYHLLALNIPSGVTKLENNMFSQTVQLSVVSIPDSVTSITGVFRECKSLLTATIPDSVTYMGGSEFYNCYSLRDAVVLPDGITKVPVYAFYYCKNLLHVDIPPSVTKLDSQSFQGCTKLTSVVIPANVTDIASYAFNGCGGMCFYDFTACTAVPTLASTNAFNGIPSDCEIRVPAALYDEWIAATNWATYADYIKAY